MRKIAVFTATRAEYGLLYWLMKAIQDSSDLDLQLLVSGMHLAPQFGKPGKKLKRMALRLMKKSKCYWLPTPLWAL